MTDDPMPASIKPFGPPSYTSLLLANLNSWSSILIQIGQPVILDVWRELRSFVRRGWVSLQRPRAYRVIEYSFEEERGWLKDHDHRNDQLYKAIILFIGEQCNNKDLPEAARIKLDRARSNFMTFSGNNSSSSMSSSRADEAEALNEQLGQISRFGIWTLPADEDWVTLSPQLQIRFSKSKVGSRVIESRREEEITSHSTKVSRSNELVAFHPNGNECIDAFLNKCLDGFKGRLMMERNTFRYQYMLKAQGLSRRSSLGRSKRAVAPVV